MSETEVGIRDLKAQLSKYLRRVKAGYTVLITERGKPVGRIIPVDQPLEARLQAMVEVGLLRWSGKRLQLGEPAARVRGARTVAELLLEDRA
jgi:prevent-host-death family protein